MNAVTGVRKKLRQVLKQDVPELIWEEADIRDMVREYLGAKTDGDRGDAWGALEDAVRKGLRFWNGGREEGLRGVQSGTRGGSREMRKAEKSDTGESTQGLDIRELVGDRTRAMTGAMSALFALIGDQFPEVKAFRERVLPERFLTPDEAHALIASHAARTLPFAYFAHWGIPIIGHRAEILDSAAHHAEFSPINDWIVLRVDPPGLTKTVRYACPRKGDIHTWHVPRNGATIPVHTDFPIESHGDYIYPPWLWPGSVVDELFELSVELAGAFDWPGGDREGNLTNTRPRSETACWFILTGEAPQVRPLNARWEMKGSSTNLNPQWRIQLTIPPWLPEEEALQAFRALRRRRPKGRQMPKTAKPLEVARFVWERERLDGYRKRAPWTAWWKQWNDEYPGHRIETASNFRTYFRRGADAVRHFNFDWPDFDTPAPEEP